ncbi:BZ3500_MvSof-1268-A1-R1_Chr3-3g06612 [Microbotryum saponariae]|uniref:BZ3500_MvSof-1268-A1-R1_Chr3-3g06612 protein n=1 Tax=Microbotryum saponariae TaxID=289078 RepID=A0A2X0KVC9_9BASI|nr:BZ3500_MvSof-1268-A1-R1_Chr3-3g06612 [Microbotryum saponariae]SDA04579.1 BZ3501_MvSof-1269-A2-R1_Chr3-2g06299 [Microbotryum saponariae]
MLHIKNPKRYKTSIRIHDPDNPRLWRAVVKTTHTDLRYSFSASTTRRLMQQGDQERAAARRRAAGVGPRETTPDPLAGAASGSHPDNDYNDYSDYNHIDQRDYGGDNGPGLALTSASSVQPTLDTSHQQLDLSFSTGRPLPRKRVPPRRAVRSYALNTWLAITNWRCVVRKLVDDFLTAIEDDREYVPLQSVPLGSNKAMEVILIDFSAHKKVSFVPSNKGAISDLLAAGYMPATPVAPRYAFFIPFIKIHMAYHYVAKATPYAGANLLEANHRTRMSAHLSKRFSDALAAFRLFVAYIESAIPPTRQFAMRCPACQHKIQEEPPLEYTAQVAIDGNASQKRLKTRYSKLGQHIHPDKHTFPSKLFIPPEIVDESEVIATRKGKGRRNAASEQKAEGDKGACASNWTAARSDQSGGALPDLDETGIVAAVCRHGVVLAACDMIQSGERSKYPLALIKRVRDAFSPRDRLLIGYDIGCVFTKTFETAESIEKRQRDPDASRPSGEAAANPAVAFCCGVWHGYTHSRPCQLQFHPRFMDAAGLEDFEGCERLWSFLNGFAASTRRATKYNRKSTLHHAIMYSSLRVLLRLDTWLSDRWKSASAQAIASLEAISLLAENVTSQDACADAGHMWLEQERRYFMHNASPPSSKLTAKGLREKELLEALENRDKMLKKQNSGVPRSRGGMVALSIANYTSAIAELIQDEVLQLTEEDREDVERLGLGWRGVEEIRARGVAQRIEELLAKLERDFLAMILEAEALKNRSHGIGTNYDTRNSDTARKRYKRVAASLTEYNKLAESCNRRQYTFEEVRYPHECSFVVLLISSVSVCVRLQMKLLAKDGMLRTGSNLGWASSIARSVTAAVSRRERALEEQARLQLEYQRVWEWAHENFQYWDSLASTSAEPQRRDLDPPDEDVQLPAWKKSALSAIAVHKCQELRQLIQSLDRLRMSKRTQGLCLLGDLSKIRARGPTPPPGSNVATPTLASDDNPADYEADDDLEEIIRALSEQVDVIQGEAELDADPEVHLSRAAGVDDNDLDIEYEEGGSEEEYALEDELEEPWCEDGCEDDQEEEGDKEADPEQDDQEKDDDNE